MEKTEDLVGRYQSSTDKCEQNEIFTKLYLLYDKLVYKAIRRANFALSKFQIEDTAQEVWISVAKRLHTFRWTSRKEFNGWVYIIAFRAGLRTRGITSPSPIDDLELVANTTKLKYEEANFTFWETWKKFDRAGFQLNRKFACENQTDKESAKQLGISEEATRKRRRRRASDFLEFLSKQYEVNSFEDWIEMYKYLDLNKTVKDYEAKTF